MSNQYSWQHETNWKVDYGREKDFLENPEEYYSLKMEIVLAAKKGVLIQVSPIH